MTIAPEDVLARVVVCRYLRVRAGDRVVVESWSHALRYARAVVLAARAAKAEAFLVVEDEEAFFRTLASRGSLAPPTAPSTLASSADAYVYLGGPEAYPRLFGLPSDDLETILGWHGPSWWRTARARRLRAAGLSIAGATPTAAARYGIDLGSWQKELVAASRIPPERLRAVARRYTSRLARARRLRIRHPNGTDLSIRLRPRSLVVEDGRLGEGGRIWTSVPTGSLTLALDPGTAEGVWESNHPVFHRYGDPAVALGARFVLSRGRVREFAFDRGGEAFARAYARGGRGRELAAGITVGLNPEIRRAPELEELAEGSVGLLLGGGRPVDGKGRGRFSYLTTLRAADVEIDGRPWIVGGRVLATVGSGRASSNPRRRTERPHPRPDAGRA